MKEVVKLVVDVCQFDLTGFQVPVLKLYLYLKLWVETHPM